MDNVTSTPVGLIVIAVFVGLIAIAEVVIACSVIFRHESQNPYIKTDEAPAAPEADEGMEMTARITQLVDHELESGLIHLITSAPGIGRDAVLRSILNSRYPDRHVVVGINDDMEPSLLGFSAMAERLQAADVIVFDGFTRADPTTKARIATLLSHGVLKDLPRQYQPSIDLRLEQDVSIIVSEQENAVLLAERELREIVQAAGRRLVVITL